MLPVYRFTNSQKMHLTLWADWLEKTTLPQTQEALKKVELDFDTDEPIGQPGYCCLGLYIQYRDPSRFSEAPSLGGEFQCPKKKSDPSTSYNTSYLPNAFAKELGIYTSQVKDVQKNDLQEVFIRLNDEFLYDFKEIAIEVRSLINTRSFTENTQEKLNKKIGYGYGNVNH